MKASGLTKSVTLKACKSGIKVISLCLTQGLLSQEHGIQGCLLNHIFFLQQLLLLLPINPQAPTLCYST